MLVTCLIHTRHDAFIFETCLIDVCEHDGWQVAMDLVENQVGFESILCRSIMKHTSHEAHLT